MCAISYTCMREVRRVGIKSFKKKTNNKLIVTKKKNSGNATRKYQSSSESYRRGKE